MKRFTKNQKSDFCQLSKSILDGIDLNKINAMHARISREHLLNNKVFTKAQIRKMPDEVAIELANQHMRAFLGMDRPNVFTGNLKKWKQN